MYVYQQGSCIFRHKLNDIQALACMLEESPVGSNLSRKAVLLMAEMLQTANRVLPLSIAAKLQVSSKRSRGSAGG